MSSKFSRVGRWCLAVALVACAGSAAFAQEEPVEPVDAAQPTTDGAATDEPFAQPARTAAPERTVATSGDTSYDLRLRELEDRVNDLNEDIFRSKARLYQLREQILQSDIGGSRSVIVYRNEMSNRFEPTQLTVGLDGNLLYSATRATADLSRSVEVYNAAMLPGPHNLSVQIELEGNGFGLFSYAEGYTFTVTDNYDFVLDDGQTIEITVEAYESGGVNAPVEDRPAIGFRVEMYDTTEDAVVDGSEDN